MLMNSARVRVRAKVTNISILQNQPASRPGEN
jgi:hypothetical protein